MKNILFILFLVGCVPCPIHDTTICDSTNVIIKDSIIIRDSLNVMDSIVIKDSLIIKDSIKITWIEKDSITYINCPDADSFLYVTKHNLKITLLDSIAKFDIISNINWTIKSSEPWLKVMVELFYTKNGERWKTVSYSGKAPDIGFNEYLQDNASGRDTAFVTLIGTKPYISQSAKITITGSDVADQVITVDRIN